MVRPKAKGFSRGSLTLSRGKGGRMKLCDEQKKMKIRKGEWEGRKRRRKEERWRKREELEEERSDGGREERWIKTRRKVQGQG